MGLSMLARYLPKVNNQDSTWANLDKNLDLIPSLTKYQKGFIGIFNHGKTTPRKNLRPSPDKAFRF